MATLSKMPMKPQPKCWFVGMVPCGFKTVVKRSSNDLSSDGGSVSVWGSGRVLLLMGVVPAIQSSPCLWHGPWPSAETTASLKAKLETEAWMMTELLSPGDTA